MRHGHDWNSIVVNGKTLRYKLVGDILQRPPGKIWRQRYVIEGTDKVHEISLKTRDKVDARRVQRSAVEEKILVGKQKTWTIKQTLADHEEYMRAEGLSAKHIANKISRINAICDGLGITQIHEIEETKIKLWIDKQKQRKTKKTKAKPISARTKHHYACSIKAFTRWLHRIPKLLNSDPLRGLRTHRRGDLKPTYTRRPFTDLEFALLCRNALVSNEVFCYLDGLDRHWAYRIADVTGYRCAELASITPAGCHLDGDSPYIEIDCTISKRRKQERQYIDPEIAAGFRQFIEGRGRKELIWPNGWYLKASKMMKLDMAGIKVDGNERLGMHALRHTNVTRTLHAAGKLGISDREVMRQCRLSSETLLSTYGHSIDENQERLIRETRRRIEFERGADGMESL